MQVYTCMVLICKRVVKRVYLNTIVNHIALAYRHKNTYVFNRSGIAGSDAVS